MEILRKYKKLSTWNFLELIDSDVESRDLLSPEDYIAYLDELKFRTYESISEGELYKLRLRVKRILTKAQAHLGETEMSTLSNLAKEI